MKEQRTKQEKTEIEDEEENDVNEEKWEREKSWDKPGPFYVFGVLLVYFSFWQLSAKGCRHNVWPSCLFFSFRLYFSIPFFPLRFLSLSFPLYLFFFPSFYSMLLYSIILSLSLYIYISMFASHDLSVIIYLFLMIAFHCFSFSVLLIFSCVCILYFLQVLSLISVYYVFSYCFCCCFWASNTSRICLNCFAMLYAESLFFKVLPDGKMLDIVLV